MSVNSADQMLAKQSREVKSAMEAMNQTYLLWAVCLGGLSAVSLPLGSVMGLQLNPRPAIISVMAAFGAGALISALSVELVAPTVFALEGGAGAHQNGEAHANFIALVIGATAGGILFVVLDYMVNSFGGFLRKTSSSITYLTARKRKRQLQLLEQLTSFSLIENLPTEHVNSLLAMVKPVSYAKGDIIARIGDPCEELIFINSGTVDVSLDTGVKTEFGNGEVTGIVTLLLDKPYAADLTARTVIDGLSLSKPDFERLRALSTEFDNAVHDLTTKRLETVKELFASHDNRRIEWLRQAGHALKTGAQIPDELELREAREEHKSAPLAIWMGILLDGIPESFVIGAGLLVMLQAKAQVLETLSFTDIVPYTLIAGLFLSNFPEALASSANMQLVGWSKGRIFLLWLSLMIITAAGAGVGFILAGSLNHTLLAFAEGLAAGAMLTMIAAAMIPEAVHMGRANLVGLSTLAGFIVAISFKLFE
jgi:CRP-like cAMP-binding protein